MRLRQERGDTLVEVLLALAILSLVTVGALAIMNRGIGTSLNVLERTEARSRLSQQAELLSYFRDQYSAQLVQGLPTNTYPASVWTELKTQGQGNGSIAGLAIDNCNKNNKSFFLDFNTTSKQFQVKDYNAATIPSESPTPGNGIWIDAVSVSNPSETSVPYVDFYVKSCWKGLSNAQNELVSTTVRLYDQ